MSLAVTYALGSLSAAAALDIVFRRFSVQASARGTYVMLAGLVWLGLQLVAITAAGVGLGGLGDVVAVGALAGVLIALANLLLVESLAEVDVSLASTVYRLNTVAVVALAILVIGEPLTWEKALGVGLAVVAVAVLYRPRPLQTGAASFRFYFLLAVAASLLRAVWGIVLKIASLDAVEPQLIMLMSAVGFIAVGAVYAIAWEGRIALARSTLAYSVATGGLIFLVANFLMLAVGVGEASVVVPIANMSFVGSLVLSTALGMEPLTGRKIIAISLAAVAILVLALATH